MAGLNGEQIRIISYDTSEVDFVSPVKQALDVDDDLDLLHKHFSIDSIVTRENDSTTEIHRKYYKNIEDTDFYERYRYFVSKIVASLIDGPLIVQKIPSFRVHLPGNRAVGAYHRDRVLVIKMVQLTFGFP